MPRVHVSALAWHLLLCVASGEDSETCDAATGKCSNGGLEYASDPPCYFPTTLLEVPVMGVREDTYNSKVITFGLPEGTSLNLPVSSAIVMNAPGAGKKGENVTRPYNPISANSQLGSFDLLVKVYEEGVVSKFADGLQVGDRVGFKQVKPNVKKWQYPFGKKRITMLAGGTGVAPMFQALHPLLKTSGDTTQVRLLYGNVSPNDILLRAELDQFAQDHPDRFEVIYVVGKSPDDESARWEDDWQGEMGWIDEEKVRRLAFPPEEGTVVWVCGVDDMYKSLAGSRAGALKPGSALHNLGYTEDMIWRS